MEKELKYLPKNAKKDWFKKVTDYYIKNSNIDDIRDFNKMKENYDLVSGIFSTNYFNDTLNPLDLKQSKNEIPVNDEIIPIILPTINTLIGEIYDRNIDFRAYVINSDAVSDKERWIKDEADKKLQSIISDTTLSQTQIKLRLMKLKQWKEYDAQDIREISANHIIKDGIERYHFLQKTKEGWKDKIENSQEFYLFELIEGNVEFTKLNPLNIKIYGLPDTGEVNKSEAIVHERYMSVGQIVKKYGKELNKKDLDKIVGNGSNLDGGILMIMNKEVGEDDKGTELIFDSDSNSMAYENERDKDKILVKTVYFKVLRKVVDLHYIDDDGKEQIEVVPADYNPIKSEGEHIDKPYYINEYWESTRILKTIYVRQKQCDVQLRDMNNSAIVLAPIVGKISLINNKVAKSIVEYLKPIQYQWTVFSKKLSLLWSRNYGKLVRLDISKIPKKYGFNVDLFISWITKFGIIVEDPFNEAMKGQAAGQFQSSVQAIDMELTSSISQALKYMIYLRGLADDIVGVNRQRRGDVLASDGLGTTQESIAHSLKITEELFQDHNETITELLYYILEYSKKTIKDGNNKKMQYITDNGSVVIYNISPDMFKSTDFGIYVSNNKKQLELDKVFFQLSQVYAQNNTLRMSELMDLYRTNSIAERINKLKLSEEEKDLMSQEQQKAQQEHEKQLQQMAQQMELTKHQYEIELQQLKNKGLIDVAEINAGNKINIEGIKNDKNDKTLENINTQNDKHNDTELSKAMLKYKENLNKNQLNKTTNGRK